MWTCCPLTIRWQLILSPDNSRIQFNPRMLSFFPGCKSIEYEEFYQIVKNKSCDHILADFGFTLPQSKAIGKLYIDIMSVVRLAYASRSLRVAVSFSSGMGWLIGYDDVKRKEAHIACKYLTQELTLFLVPNFAFSEVSELVKALKEQDSTFPSSEDLFSITKGNPLLISHAIKVGKRFKYKIDLLVQSVIEELSRLVFSVVRHVSQEEVVELLFGEHCGDVAALAETESTVSIRQYSEYAGTWIVKENLIYATHSDDREKWTFHSNFPNIYRSIFNLLRSKTRLPPSVFMKPQVKGYLLEDHFFETVKSRGLQLFLCDCKKDEKCKKRSDKSISLIRLNVANLSVVKSMVANTVYTMLDCHPGVDALLYYSDDGNNYLFFFQISLSSYSEQKAKASAVNQATPQSKRIGTPVSILKYYRSLIEDKVKVNIVYAYISPKELTTEMVDTVANDVKLWQHQIRKAKSGAAKPSEAKDIPVEVNMYGVVEGGSDCSKVLFVDFS